MVKGKRSVSRDDAVQNVCPVVRGQGVRGRSQAAEVGGAAAASWCLGDPGVDVREVEGCRWELMLKVRLGGAVVARTSQPHLPDTLRDRALDARSRLVAPTPLVRFPLFACLAERFEFLAVSEGQAPADPAGAACALGADGAGPAVVRAA